MKLDIALCKEYLGLGDVFWALAREAERFMVADEVCTVLFEEFAQRLVQQQSIAGGNEICGYMLAHLRAFAPAHMPMGAAVYLGACLPAALGRLRAYGVNEEVLHETFHDFERWAGNYEAQHGHPGIGELPWALYPFSGQLLHLGRLMYQQRAFQFPYYIFRDKSSGALVLLFADTLTAAGNQMSGQVVDTSAAGISGVTQDFDRRQYELLLAPGMQVLDIHIPRQGALLPAQVDASLAQAREFYAQRGYPAKVAVCYSWLLDPALERIVPHSNSAAFMRRFAKFPARQPVSSVAKFVFGPEHTLDDPAKLPAHSSLQKAMVRYLEQGGRLADTGGVLVL